jgi:hypothetical protein
MPVASRAHRQAVRPFVLFHPFHSMYSSAPQAAIRPASVRR